MMSRRRFGAGLAAAMVQGLSACATAPPSASLPDVPPGFRPADPDELGLWQNFERNETGYRTSGLCLNAPDLVAYLKDMCCRMAVAYCPDLRLYLLRNPEFNASMAANGMIVVHTGLLLWCANESQVAAVLGHEIGHYLRRHSLARLRDELWKRDAAAFLGLTPYGRHAGAGVDAMIRASLKANSRDHEREADAVGVKLMAAAGYDPVEAARVWERMIAVTRFAGTDAPVSRTEYVYMHTHPLPPERMAALYETAKALGSPAVPPPDMLKRHILPVRGMMLADQLGSGAPTTEALLDVLVRDNPDNAGEVHFFVGEFHRRRGKGREDLDRALAAYRSALVNEGAPADTHRSLGLVLTRLGRRGEAAEAFRTYLRLRPMAPDRDIVAGYLERGG